MHATRVLCHAMLRILPRSLRLKPADCMGPPNGERRERKEVSLKGAQKEHTYFSGSLSPLT